MMNQPLRRVDPLGRSAPLNPERPNLPWLSAPSRGSVWPIGGGSERAIVDRLRTRPSARGQQESIADATCEVLLESGSTTHKSPPEKTSTS